MAASELVGRKHAIVYLRALIGFAIWFSIFGWLFVWLATTTRFHVPPMLVLVVLGLVGLTLLFFLLSWMDVRSFTWTVTDGHVELHSGWLFWRKTSFNIPYETIFEAYYTFGFFAKILHYGHCVIRRTEGVTSTTGATYMAVPEKLVGAINAKVKEYRARAWQPIAMVAPAVAPAFGPAKTAVQQIGELAALKRDGAITTEEFEVMKKKIIQGKATA